MNELGHGLGGLFFADRTQMMFYVLMDIERAELRAEGAAIAEREERRRLRDEKLRLLPAREVFAAGSVLLAGSDGRPDPRPVVVAVTEDELVLLDAHPVAPEEELARIQLGEIGGVRLLDEHGETVTRAPSEVEEIDEPERRYVVWVDRNAEGSTGGHAFVFLAWSAAAEAERDFRRQLIS